ADHHFISSLLERSLDFSELLSSISFRVPSHSTRNHSLFQLPHHRTSYGFNHRLHRMLLSLNSA
ncbi:Reverse transcriptase domain-containing protein, partial [Aphis craccivora]